MMIFISEEEIKFLLTWDDTIKATEAAMKSQSMQNTVSPARSFSGIFDKSKWMLSMPGYLDDEKYGGWACKILTVNTENARMVPPSPVHNANVVLFDQNTGALEAILSGMQITNWRTAAASAVATKYLHSSTSKPQKILAIFGCGDQGRAHALCFNHCFQFEEIRLWNRTTRRAIELANELNKQFGTEKFKAIEEKEACAKGADVIVTTTSPGTNHVVYYEWLKEGVHINAVGVVSASKESVSELDEETYKHAHVYVDNWTGANKELTQLKQYGAQMKAEVGEVILGKASTPSRNQITIFQSLGMASEDCAMARLVHDLYMQRNIKK